ncbi:ferritin, CCC1 [Metallosphaera tengchongensis]|uniref:Ferritin, CCC1 n=1 Tax=Metallosphaera tengchongensis TaxID=1532350 RepID=A0A6N0NY69_9CREN|nr:VIT1/CCC1 family protein [Metallosphaera tengchongensis]QKR00318.1 ferritin, CCC1 [Metallosphaera tengchongensis]
MEQLVRSNFKSEIFGKELYSALAETEKDEKVREVLEELAEGEGNHADFWRKLAEARGIELEGLGLWERFKLWLLTRLRRVLGLALTLKIAESGESNDAEKYHELSQSGEFSDSERQGFRDIMMQELMHEDLLIQSQVNVDSVRESIYAVSDGLIEVLASVSGLAGIFSVPLYVALGGLIVGVSGMISMSIGAYLSSKSEEDIKNNAKRKALLKGEEVEDEKSRAGESVKTTAISYILGAIVPVIPFLLGLQGLLGLFMSYAITGGVTFLVGSLIGLLSDVSPWRKGALMTGLALGAALVTHLLGILAHMAGVG